MAGINQGRPKVAVGEPIRFGDIEGFEIEQHPISDRLIIRDTANGTVAYVRKDRGGQVGGDGTLIKALKEGKPMADDGRTHDSIQEAERQASGWVFVPPGTFNEHVDINTEGLTLKGCGYSTFLVGSKNTIYSIEDNVTISNIRTEVTREGQHALRIDGDNTFVTGYTAVNTADQDAIILTDGADNAVIHNCTVEASGRHGINIGVANGTVVSSCLISNSKIGISSGRNGINSIIANNIIKDTRNDNIAIGSAGEVNEIVSGNRCINAGDDGIYLAGNNCIVANNRVSDATDKRINDNGTGTLLDGNLTGASN